MTKLEDVKTVIIAKLKSKEYVIDAEFDEHVMDAKPFGFTFYRLNILHKNENGEATFSAKGVYINASTGKYFLHSGGVSTKSLVKKVVESIE